MKGQMKRIVAVMLSIMMVFTLVPLSSVNAASKAKLNKKSATIYVGKTVQLKVNNNKKKVKWSTSNKKIAIVNKKGKVTGKKAGKVTRDGGSCFYSIYRRFQECLSLVGFHAMKL